MPKRKLYCYADETGQDTQGRFFLVSVVIIDKSIQESLKQELLRAERRAGKRRARWTKNRPKVRISYLKRISSLSGLQHSIFYSVYQDTTDYVTLTACTIVQAIQARVQQRYEATIEIDGFNDAQLHQVRKTLKVAGIRYRKLRGPRDQSLVFIRLADALAGFLRDYEEGQAYTRQLLNQFVKRGFIAKLS